MQHRLTTPRTRLDGMKFASVYLAAAVLRNHHPATSLVGNAPRDNGFQPDVRPGPVSLGSEQNGCHGDRPSYCAMTVAPVSPGFQARVPFWKVCCLPPPEVVVSSLVGNPSFPGEPPSSFHLSRILPDTTKACV
jgi:hypothetical protein